MSEIYQLNLFRSGVLSSIHKNGKPMMNVIDVTITAGVYEPTRMVLTIEPDQIQANIVDAEVEYLTNAE